MKSYFLSSVTAIFLWGLCFSNVHGQTSHSNNSDQASLPDVFLLGEFDDQYEQIMPEYQTLLDACNGDMRYAFGKLQSMMKEMEAYAELSGYDLKGINSWMHFFWTDDGTIEHIGFYLKPNSKNINTDKFKAFLADFASNYKFPHTSDSGFAHYSSFSFPIVYSASAIPGKNETARNGN